MTHLFKMGAFNKQLIHLLKDYKITGLKKRLHNIFYLFAYGVNDLSHLQSRTNHFIHLLFHSF